jgi:RNA 2',3'-cyclic 3'-phosphodiesterase
MSDIRCFIAIELPPSMREDIRRIEDGLRVPGLRLVRPEICHITLKFLGDVPENQIERICEALKSVRSEPFEAKVRGVGAFPGKSIRVVWLGLEGNFSQLHRLVDELLEPLGFEREGRKFSPHVTLGRVSRPSPQISKDIASRMDQYEDIDLGSFSVGRFLLKKSTLTREGPIYEDIAEFLLRPTG